LSAFGGIADMARLAAGSTQSQMTRNGHHVALARIATLLA
jgi:hypothetical protein